MDINEALQWADQWTEGHTFYEGMQGWRVVCATLAAEVRRLQAVEAVPVAWARADLLPLAPDRYTPCILTPTKCVSTPVPLYKHPPALDDKKHQRLLSENARLSILNHLYNQIADGRTEFSAMDMDYWDSSHDKLLEAIQNKLDDDTRKLVLELCHEITMRYSANLHPEIYRRAENLRVKLGAGDE